MYDIPGSNGTNLRVWDTPDRTLIEPNTLAQAKMLLDLDFVKGVSLMPDAHVGIGATVGSVIVTDHDTVIPAAVGVDIGCGMLACRLTFLSPDQLDDSGFRGKVYDAIRKAVPSGFPCVWPDGKIPKRVMSSWEMETDRGVDFLRADYEVLRGRYPSLPGKNDVNQLGTLGSGNHFIEVCVDAEPSPCCWLVLHSGSRGIGNRIGTYFIREAKRVCKKRGVTLPHFDLAYLRGDEMGEYLSWANWAQRFAHMNRLLMRAQVIDAFADLLDMPMASPVRDEPGDVHCHHNFVTTEWHDGKEVLVTRKGAVRAERGEWGIIPGSMGACTYLTQGLGNPLSFNSSSHGAGRLMGRKAAKKTITLADHETTLAGITCDMTEATLDESPLAYKPISDVMAAQADLTEHRIRLRQRVCVKGQE